ncbi:MAG: glycosyltransferase family 2 protein [Oscillochloridaceae bacterium umkhey_bin13]
MNPSLGIIIVSWNVADVLRCCLLAVTKSLADHGLTATIYVVDNASHDGTPTMLQAEFPAVHLIEAGANLGFGAGNNLALRLALAAAHRYLLLLNPDTKPEADAIPQLVYWLESHPKVALVGPRLIYGDGTPQPSRRRFPNWLSMAWESTPLERLWPGNPWAARYRCADRPDDHEQAVDWLVGAALLVRAEAVRRGGLFDERFFMYSEELEWQARLSRAWGHSEAIWYTPTATIHHYEGKSSEQAVVARYLHFNQSKLLLARMWYGWQAAALLRVVIRLGFGYELVNEVVKLLLAHRPELRRQRIGVYWSVLRHL